jgi:hypothetical protein
MSAKFVCVRCVEGDSLANAIFTNMVESRCDYCGRRSRKPIAAPVDVLVEPVLEGLQTEWADPGDELYYDGRDGGYQGETFSSDDLLLWEIDRFSEHESLVEEIADLLSDYHWCKKDYGLLRPGEALTYGWSNFCHKVKHETRYMFFEEASGPPELRHPDDVRPEEMLGSVGYAVREAGLVRAVEVGKRFVRARVDAPSAIHGSADALGPPPLEYAVQPNRMSPAGIPMFYGAVEADTALAEVRSNDPTPVVATIAIWSASRPFDIVDLTQLPPAPSIFDRASRHLRDPILFLREFIRDLAKPITRDRHEHIEYVPTQIVTEYFRYRFRSGTREGPSGRIQGLAYPSSRHLGGVAVVLFFDQMQCRDSATEHDDVWLVLDRGTLRRVNLP